MKKDVVKFIKRQDKIRQQQITGIIDSLSEDPYQVKNIRPIIGLDENIYRVRFGDFRLLYKVNKEELIILIIKIGPRGDVYKK